jgi:diguanylate cyclase (GGDEF)-like protein
MISLKKFFDAQPQVVKSTEAAGSVSDSVADSADALSAYQTALAAMGAHGRRAVPVLGTMISNALARIGDDLAHSASPESVRDSGRKVEEQLSLWADQAQQNQKESEKTIAELLLRVSEAAESTGHRDAGFGREIGGLCDRLRAVAGLDSLPVIRKSISENTSALSTCVAKMTEDGRDSVRKLSSQIAEYQMRLRAAERRALVDALTGLPNRFGFEQQLELRIQSRQPFSILVVDLNGFKAVNDRLGHLVGDEILKQFAGEMRTQFPSHDTVARWGGDEFAGIVAGPAAEGAVRAERIRHWVLGEYRITNDNKTVIVNVDAALGIAAWDGIESGLELFARADKEMYLAKESRSAIAQVPIDPYRTSTVSAAESPRAAERRGGRAAIAVSSGGSSVPSKRQ